MTRPTVPKTLKEALLDEYDHRCAICGGDRPHVHHIDEDSSHNALDNLLPLCPNCHLRDQHNPTRKVDIPKLQLFRQYKDPAILKPQFHPIYLRQRFLDSITPGEDSVTDLESHAKELIEFIEALEMGDFYGKRLAELVGPPSRAIIMSFDAESRLRYDNQRRSANSDYREQLIRNREAAQSLLVELLRYQGWANV